MHNTAWKQPHFRGHIFDFSKSKRNLTCALVRQAQNEIEAGYSGDEQAQETTKRAHENFLNSLVVERWRKAPLRVEDHTLNFIGDVIDYADLYCNGNMLKQVNFTWPYTKAEARLHANALKS
jgi:hypothetical protein